MSIAANSAYLTPRGSNNAELTTRKRKGVFTLTANTTYFYLVGGAAAPYIHVQLTGYTAGIVITSATIKSCSHNPEDVSDVSTTDGEWIAEDPTAGDVRTDGTGWSQPSPTIAAAAGSGVGGASWQLIGWGPARTALVVVVGATGGDVAVSMHGKA